MNELRKAAQAALEVLEAGNLYTHRIKVACDTLRSAPAQPDQPTCACGDCPKDKCPGEWEPGCDFGANEKYVRAVPVHPTADVPTHEDGQADNSPGPCTSDRGISEPSARTINHTSVYAAKGSVTGGISGGYITEILTSQVLTRGTFLFTADQMRAFRAEGVAQERERCAKKVEDEDVAPTDDPIGVQQCIAASIRKG